ncbi:MAG: carbohydrate kinase family protein [Desulfurococcaceae archaeon]
MRSLDAIGYGDICVDYVIKVKRFPNVDEKVYMVGSSKHGGGVTANFAVGISRLGALTGFVGGIGKDENGRFLLELLKKDKIDTSFLKIYDDRETAVNFIILEETGDRRIIMDPLLRENVPPPEVFGHDLEMYLGRAKVLHTSAIKLPAAINLSKVAKKNNVLISFDLEKHIIEQFSPEIVVEMIKLTDILLPNKMGAIALTGETSLIDAGKKLLSLGPKVVIITLGERGCLALTKDRIRMIPAFKIKPVDTTGAGDAFNAGFIYGYVIKGMDIDEATQLANLVAAIKCTKLGAQSGMPLRSEVEKFIGELKLKISLN